MLDQLGRIVGGPVVLEELKVRAGRRQTFRARGPRGTVIVKIYATDRASTVAERVASLAAGPREPVLPTVLHVDPAGRFVVFSDLPGRPLREAVVNGELGQCRRAGRTLAEWHSWWAGRAPAVLRPQTVDRELAILRDRAAAASPRVAAAVGSRAPGLATAWPLTTVVHRDLYEEQLLLDEKVALIDLDDAATGPPELDIGNLVAHLELLGLRRMLDTGPAVGAVVDGYVDSGAAPDRALVERCRSLSLLRLACLNDDLRLVDLAVGAAV